MTHTRQDQQRLHGLCCALLSTGIALGCGEQSPSENHAGGAGTTSASEAGALSSAGRAGASTNPASGGTSETPIAGGSAVIAGFGGGRASSGGAGGTAQLGTPHNPVLKGFNADPQIALFDGKFYIYPTMAIT